MIVIASTSWAIALPAFQACLGLYNHCSGSSAQYTAKRVSVSPPCSGEN